ncbi:MAG: TfoX/Sxy family protein [Candidatus Limnocylindria bacterium]
MREMHQGHWQKAPPELVDRFSAAVAALPGAQVRKMFGYPAAFANGYMFTGIFADQWFVRLSEPEHAELAAVGGGEFAPMPGRPMRGYLTLPADLLADPDARAAWLARALAHVQALPPKTKR